MVVVSQEPPLLVVEEAFRARGPGVVIAPRFVWRGVGKGPVEICLRTPDGKTRVLIATLDLAHVSGSDGVFAMFRLLGVEPGDVPPGTEIRLV